MLVNIVDFVLSLEIGISRLIQNGYKVIKKFSYIQHARADFYANCPFAKNIYADCPPWDEIPYIGTNFSCPPALFENNVAHRK